MSPADGHPRRVHLPRAPDGAPAPAGAPDVDADGWVRRHLAAPAQAEEARALYESLGFEVELRSPDPAEMSADCGECREVVCRTYVRIHTRRRER